MFLYRFWRALLHLIYPELCMGCGIVLFDQENLICSECLYHLPYTDFHLDPNNPVMQQVKGRADVEFGTAMLFLFPKTIVQNLIYNLKYKNHPKVGDRLGEMYGKILREDGAFAGVDVLVPIPLHPSRRAKRGYNQCEYICKGLSRGMDIPVDFKLLARRIHHKSQTRLSRMERARNVVNIFECRHVDAISDQHILIVDDVFTTGATLCAAVECVKEAFPHCRVSILTIAKA